MRKQGLPVELCVRGAVAWDLQGHPLSSRQLWEKHNPGPLCCGRKGPQLQVGTKQPTPCSWYLMTSGVTSAPRAGQMACSSASERVPAQDPPSLRERAPSLAQMGCGHLAMGHRVPRVPRLPGVNGCRVSPRATDWAVPSMRRQQAGAIRPLLVRAHPLLHLSLYPRLPGPLAGTTRWGPVYRWVCVVSGTSQRNDHPGNCQLPGGRLVTLGPSHHGRDGQRCVLSRRTILSPGPTLSRIFQMSYSPAGSLGWFISRVNLTEFRVLTHLFEQYFWGCL